MFLFFWFFVNNVFKSSDVLFSLWNVSGLDGDFQLYINTLAKARVNIILLFTLVSPILHFILLKILARKEISITKKSQIIYISIMVFGILVSLLYVILQNSGYYQFIEKSYIYSALFFAVVVGSAYELISRNSK